MIRVPSPPEHLERSFFLEKAASFVLARLRQTA
jgi:hypothetical protein